MSHPIQFMFDKISSRYDFLNHFLSLGRDRIWRKKAVLKLRAVRKTQDTPIKILDLCGGTGDFAEEALRQSCSGSKALIADFSLGMIQKVIPKKISALPMQADAQILPIKTEKFDIALCGFGMRNITNLSQGLQEVLRSLKPGGHLLVLEFFAPQGLWPNFFYKVLAPLFLPAVAVLFGSQLSAYQYLVRSIKGFQNTEQFAQTCFKAGYGQVLVQPLDGGLCALVIAQKPPVEEMPWDSM